MGFQFSPLPQQNGSQSWAKDELSTVFGLFVSILDGLDVSMFCELFVHCRLEFSLMHQQKKNVRPANRVRVKTPGVRPARPVRLVRLYSPFIAL